MCNRQKDLKKFEEWVIENKALTDVLTIDEIIALYKNSDKNQ